MSVCAPAVVTRSEHRLWAQLGLWLLVFFGVPPEVLAHDPVALLERMAESSHLLNYDGIFVYRRAGASDSMRIIHRASADGGTERLMTLSGESREIVRDAEGTRCFLADSGEMVLLRSAPRPLMPTEITRPWAQIGEFYTFNLEGTDRVAGRSARVVAISPRTADRYGYRLWLDVESGLLLRSDLVNGEGIVLEQVEFLSLEFPERIPDELLRPAPAVAADAGTVQSLTDRQPDKPSGGAKSGGASWRAAWLPAGFKLEHVQRLSHGKPGPAFEHLAYSDGLTVLSVFVEASGHAPEGATGFSVLGAAVSFSTENDGHTITVVGEAPPLTVRRVAEGIERQP
ncbi:MAG TPA: hypothetical protein DCY89_04665 [Gammaproteobacteria bacterium]|nr:hypothetical protein [Gammaproteobacteria bacterium]